MKRSFQTFVIAFVFSLALNAQAPKSFKYQAIARDAVGLVANKEVSVKISILEGSSAGTEKYSETKVLTTNEYGLINLTIGEDNPTNFAKIDWSAGEYWVSVDLDGVKMGASQILSVPYALHSGAADSLSNGFSGDFAELTNAPDPVITSGDQSIAGVKTFTSPVNVATPADPANAATKAYVDDNFATVKSGTITLASNQKIFTISASEVWLVTVVVPYTAPVSDTRQGSWIVYGKLNSYNSTQSIVASIFTIDAVGATLTAVSNVNSTVDITMNVNSGNGATLAEWSAVKLK